MATVKSMLEVINPYGSPKKPKIRILECRSDGTADEVLFLSLNKALKSGLDDRDVFDYGVSGRTITLYI